jgi:glutathione S-transferase
MKPLLIVGNYLSPYVRKVLLALELKGIAYEIDPIVPFFGNDAFSKLSPLRRIPVLVDGDLVLTDSTVISEYLDDLKPEPRLYPADIRDRARARWLEEFADTRMGDVFIWHFFAQIAVRRGVWGEDPDKALIERTQKEEMPAVLDYLEAEAPADGFRFSALSMADMAPACMLRTAAYTRFQVDAARWPKTAAWMERTYAAAPFEKLSKFEAVIARVSPPQHRETLKSLGAPLSAVSYADSKPRRGVMSTT